MGSCPRAPRKPSDGSLVRLGQPGEELVRELRDRVDGLERQLGEANTRYREQQRIIAGLTQRIPAIVAPIDVHRDAPGWPERSEAGGDKGNNVPVGPQTATSRPEERSWWRRWLVG